MWMWNSSGSDVITARALASLTELFGLSQKWWDVEQGGSSSLILYLFQKEKNWQRNQIWLKPSRLRFRNKFLVKLIPGQSFGFCLM